jgi:hypothetical protein
MAVLSLGDAVVEIFNKIICAGALAAYPGIDADWPPAAGR